MEGGVIIHIFLGNVRLGGLIVSLKEPQLVSDNHIPKSMLEATAGSTFQLSDLYEEKGQPLSYCCSGEPNVLGNQTRLLRFSVTQTKTADGAQ